MAKPDSEIWNDVLVHVRNTYPTIHRHWFNTLEHSDLDGGVATIVAPSATFRDYLESSCAEAFDDAIRTVTQRLVTCRFVADGDDAARLARADSESGRPPVEHPARRAAKVDENGMLPLSPDYSFNHYVIGPGNRIAHAAAMAVADNPGLAYNPFFVYGQVGLGKTHILQAICQRVRQNRPTLRIAYTSCEHFMTRFMKDVKAGQMAEFRHNFRHVDMLVIDDIQFLAKREQTQEEFVNTFNELYLLDKQIVMSCDSPPEEIKDLAERLVNRFKSGLVTQILPPGFETRVEIVKEKGRLRGLTIANDVAELIASRVESNVRELESALSRIQLQAVVDKAPITLSLAELALNDGQRSAHAPVTIEQIIEHITDYFGVKLSDLQSRKRTRSIALPRQVGMYLAKQHTRHSLQEIGGYFGGRDHTTVLHAVRTIGDRSTIEPELGRAISTIETKLRMPGRHE
ncbi:MAG TPA: chromosomal replication initiator protein DnaA [Phycisphaerales bacterium]|nr:chromosomal replication initiator protein DnaA [Phycisphaerales bacterium]